MKSMDSQKKRRYLVRILNQENGAFTPLIFSSNGLMSKEIKGFYSRLAGLILDKTHTSLTVTSAWIKTKLLLHTEYLFSNPKQKVQHPSSLGYSIVLGQKRLQPLS